MSVLLDEIKRINPTAGHKLERQKFCTDSDLKWLTREDLRELFPGEHDLRLRKTIYETIHRQRPIGLLLSEMKDFIPDDALRAALSNTGVLVDYLHILKDMKAQMDNVQTFLDAHISLLEDIKKTQPNKKADEGGFEVLKDISPDAQSSSSSWWNGSSSTIPTETQKFPHEEPQYSANSWRSGSSSSVPMETQYENPPRRSLLDSPGTSRASTGGPVPSVNPTGFSPHTTRRTIKYKMELSGNTLDAHQQILDRIQNQDSSSVSLNLVNSSDMDSDVTLLFCPIASRAGTDVETAMKRVKDDKLVILVVMRHSHEVKPVAPKRTWSHFSNVLLHTTVFYHDTVNGLLNCQENTDAICEIRKELLKHSYETAAEFVVPEHGNSERFPSEPAYGVRRANSVKNAGYYFSSLFRR